MKGQCALKWMTGTEGNQEQKGDVTMICCHCCSGYRWLNQHLLPYIGQALGRTLVIRFPNRVPVKNKIPPFLNEDRHQEVDWVAEDDRVGKCSHRHSALCVSPDTVSSSLCYMTWPSGGLAANWKWVNASLHLESISRPYPVRRSLCRRFHAGEWIGVTFLQKQKQDRSTRSWNRWDI